MEHKMHRTLRKTVIILLWLIVWQIAAVWTDNHILLVGPVEVLRSFVRNVTQPDFLRTILFSLARIGLGFLLALLTGLILGTISYCFPFLQELLAPVMAALKSIPVASFVVLLLIWFGSSKLSFFISFLIVFPNIYVNTIAGLTSADVKLLEMADVFGMGKLNCFFYIYRPALMPYLDSCLKISLGMSWKSGVAAEIIGLSDHSLGEKLYMSKISLDTAGLFAWTLIIVLLSFLFEKLILMLVGTFGEWKPYPIRAKSNKVFTKHPSSVEDTRDSKASPRQTETVNHMVDHIQVSNISKSFGVQSVLQDFSLHMEKGKHYVLMAPSGTGKTTFLRILTGLDNADSGKITGVPAHVGMVFQEDRLCEEYDAICNIMLGMGQGTGTRSGTGTGIETGADTDDYKSKEGGENGMNRAQTVAYIKKEAAKILPEECLTKPVKELSGGMRRRVALLRAVLSGSDLLILDEPFTGLDEDNRARSADYLLDHLRGRTLLVTAHKDDDVELLRGIKVTLVFSESLCYNA